MKLIGLAGPKRGGKNTTAKLIAEIAAEDHKMVVEASFAAKLKALGARSLGFEGDVQEMIDVADDGKDNWTITITGGKQPRVLTGRQFWQLLGTEGGRQTLGDTFWVDQVLPPLRAAAASGWGDLPAAHVPLESIFGPADIAVITDARFPNEAERIKLYGGEVWEILRPTLGGDLDGHASETPLPRELVDVSIVNDGTLDDLKELVRKCLA